MPPAGFEPAIAASDRPQTHALHRVPTGIRQCNTQSPQQPSPILLLIAAFICAHHAGALQKDSKKCTHNKGSPKEHHSSLHCQTEWPYRHCKWFYWTLSVGRWKCFKLFHEAKQSLNKHETYHVQFETRLLRLLLDHCWFLVEFLLRKETQMVQATRKSCTNRIFQLQQVSFNQGKRPEFDIWLRLWSIPPPIKFCNPPSSLYCTNVSPPLK
jgi:hypothetical protein